MEKNKKMSSKSNNSKEIINEPIRYYFRPEPLGKKTDPNLQVANHIWLGVGEENRKQVFDYHIYAHSIPFNTIKNSSERTDVYGIIEYTTQNVIWALYNYGLKVETSAFKEINKEEEKIKLSTILKAYQNNRLKELFIWLTEHNSVVVHSTSIPNFDTVVAFYILKKCLEEERKNPKKYNENSSLYIFSEKNDKYGNQFKKYINLLDKYAWKTSSGQGINVKENVHTLIGCYLAIMNFNKDEEGYLLDAEGNQYSKIINNNIEPYHYLEIGADLIDCLYDYLIKNKITINDNHIDIYNMEITDEIVQSNEKLKKIIRQARTGLDNSWIKYNKEKWYQFEQYKQNIWKKFELDRKLRDKNNNESSLGTEKVRSAQIGSWKKPPPDNFQYLHAREESNVEVSIVPSNKTNNSKNKRSEFTILIKPDENLEESEKLSLAPYAEFLELLEQIEDEKYFINNETFLRDRSDHRHDKKNFLNRAPFSATNNPWNIESINQDYLKSPTGGSLLRSQTIHDVFYKTCTKVRGAYVYEINEQIIQEKRLSEEYEQLKKINNEIIQLQNNKHKNLSKQNKLYISKCVEQMQAIDKLYKPTYECNYQSITETRLDIQNTIAKINKKNRENIIIKPSLKYIYIELDNSFIFSNNEILKAYCLSLRNKNYHEYNDDTFHMINYSICVYQEDDYVIILDARGYPGKILRNNCFNKITGLFENRNKLIKYCNKIKESNGKRRKVERIYSNVLKDSSKWLTEYANSNSDSDEDVVYKFLYKNFDIENLYDALMADIAIAYENSRSRLTWGLNLLGAILIPLTGIATLDQIGIFNSFGVSIPDNVYLILLILLLLVIVFLLWYYIEKYVFWKILDKLEKWFKPITTPIKKWWKKRKDGKKRKQ